jgi:hypothetical protein
MIDQLLTESISHTDAFALSERDCLLATTCADLDVRFERIRFVHPRLEKALQGFEIVRLSAKEAQKLIAASGKSDGSDIPGFPQLILVVIAPAGSGKTTNALSYISWVNAREHAHAGYRPVIYVELSEKSDPRKLWSDILRAMKHPYPEDLPEGKRRLKVYQLLRELGVQVLFIDEAHNVLHREDGTLKLSVLDGLKHLANMGLCAVVLMGVERLMPFITDPKAKEFKARLRPLVLLTPLDRTIPAEWDLFREYLAKLDIAMVRAGLTDAPSGLHSAHVDLLYDASSYEWGDYHGAITGDASKVVRFALERMVHRVVRDPQNEPRIITRNDLEQIVRNHVLPLQLGDKHALEKRGFARLIGG